MQVTEDKQLLECGACGDCRETSLGFLILQSRVCGPDSGLTRNHNTAKGLSSAVSSLCSTLKSRTTPIRVFSFDGSKFMVDGVQMAIKKMADAGRAILHPPKGFADEYLPTDMSNLVRIGLLCICVNCVFCFYQ